MTVRQFGKIEDAEILEIEIESAAAKAKVITWGAVVRDLRINDKPVALGLERIEDYVAYSPYFGAVAGRFANRIREGRFTLDGQTWTLDLNQDGRHHLHGGARGFGKRPWTLVSSTSREVRLALVSAAGDMGYPGQVRASCLYALDDPATLRIELLAEADAPTPINLTNHTYFNLDGSDDILGHTLMVHASHVTLVDSDLIPTGALAPVADSAYDFRTPRRIGGEALNGLFRYDVNYVLDRATPGLAHAATLASDKSGLSMETWTTEPGLQFYDGFKISVPVPGLAGRTYGSSSGLCLEAQRFPDAPNHPHFPSSILRPGEIYRHVTEYRFR